MLSPFFYLHKARLTALHAICLQCFLYSVLFGYPSSSSSRIICSMVSSICTRSSSIRWHFSCIS